LTTILNLLRIVLMPSLVRATARLAAGATATLLLAGCGAVAGDASGDRR